MIYRKRMLAWTIATGVIAFSAGAEAKRNNKTKDAVGHQPTALENTYQLCQDGIDNDGDTYIDCADQDCQLFAICAGSALGGFAASDSASVAVAADRNGPASADEVETVIDLDSLEEAPAPAPSEENGGHPGHGHGGISLKPPKLKLFFDLLAEYEIESKGFQFTRDHAHVMLELSAMDWLSFRADIAFEPEFYEAIFHIKNIAEVRVGKILVPWGQNEFHHLIGGRVDDDGLFLPTVWGDYGVALKHFVYDGDFVSIDYALYVVNGFQDTVDANGVAVPSRSDGRLKDNNQMKGVGFRPQLHLGTAVTLGTSWYFDAWDPENQMKMLVYGGDIELGYGLIPVPVLRNLRLRAEAGWAEIKLAEGTNGYHGIFAGDLNGIMPNFGMRRSGYNVELSYRIIQPLCFRFRVGRLNADNRIKDANDLRIFEPGLVATLGPVQLSFMAQIHVQLADEADLVAAGTPDAPNESKLLLRMLFRY